MKANTECNTALQLCCFLEAFCEVYPRVPGETTVTPAQMGEVGLDFIHQLHLAVFPRIK